MSFSMIKEPQQEYSIPDEIAWPAPGLMVFLGVFVL